MWQVAVVEARKGHRRASCCSSCHRNSHCLPSLLLLLLERSSNGSSANLLCPLFVFFYSHFPYISSLNTFWNSCFCSWLAVRQQQWVSHPLPPLLNGKSVDYVITNGNKVDIGVSRVVAVAVSVLLPFSWRWDRQYDAGVKFQRAVLFCYFCIWC